MPPYGKVSFVSFLLIHYLKGSSIGQRRSWQDFDGLPLLQIQNPQILHMKNVNWVYPKRKQ